VEGVEGEQTDADSCMKIACRNNILPQLALFCTNIHNVNWQNYMGV